VTTTTNESFSHSEIRALCHLGTPDEHMTYEGRYFVSAYSAVYLRLQQEAPLLLRKPIVRAFIRYAKVIHQVQ